MILAPLCLLAASATFEDSFRTGLLALQRSDLRVAQSSLEAASKLSPANARVWVALAQTYRKLGDARKAATAAARAELLASKDAVARTTLAKYHEEESYFEAAQSLLQASKFAEALDVLKMGLARWKDSAQLRLGMGVSLYGLRRFDEAAEAFLRTIELRPEIPQPYVFIGKFLDQVPDRWPEIGKRFEEFARANPNDATGYYLRAKFINAKGDDAAVAEDLLRSALRLNPADGPTQFEMGVAQERLRHYDAAAAAFQRATEIQPDDPAAHYRLARMYDRLGKPELAAAEREKHVALEKAARGAK